MTALATDTGARARVLIAADHDATRTGIRLALAGAADVSEADDAQAAVDMAVRDRPDVCVVDFTPAGRGIRATAEITTRFPGATVVVMTDRIDEDEFLTAIQAGATGYVSQQIDPARLPHLIRDLMRGEAAVPRALVTRLLDEFRGRERRRLALREQRGVELTEREWQVVEALRHGMTTRQIAERLGIHEVTVRRHISGVHHKVGVRTRSELLDMLASVEGAER
ncbi:MAG TPA: response regulator transcription factor [Humibacter sp.]|nr:response regulator transcription factor [Humibacter sp.]